MTRLLVWLCEAANQAQADESDLEEEGSMQDLMDSTCLGLAIIGNSPSGRLQTHRELTRTTQRQPPVRNRLTYDLRPFELGAAA